MVRNLEAEERAKLDAAIYSRPGADEPWWWEGEEDAAATAEAFGATMTRRR
jgi:hypothetical protein